VGVRHGLPGRLACVEYNAVTRPGDSLGHRNAMRLACYLLEKAATSFRDRREVGKMFFRYDQHMYGRLRIDIPEGDRPGTFPHALSRDVTGGDPAEQAISHPGII
jgi:hypothetical protein